MEKQSVNCALPPEMFHANVMVQECPSRRVLSHVTSRWGVLVLIALSRAPKMRYGELRRAIGGVSERMLAQTLQTLEADGFVYRQAFEVVPPHVEYRLTPPGKEVAKLVAKLAFWIEENLDRLPAGVEARASMDSQWVSQGFKRK
jgi:DNA-binding HxlR family transcriptional regulator